jgi:pimeloyl-ACP methyl ester carboxylesterase
MKHTTTTALADTARTKDIEDQASRWPLVASVSTHDSIKVAQLLQSRCLTAARRWGERLQRAGERQAAAAKKMPATPWHIAAASAQHAVDFTQRSLILWDTLRQRGNNFIEHERQGLPPVLHFEHEVEIDGRSFERPVNYALLRIVPPAGVTVDAKRRPYVIIDPRGGHGPGIGGFKDDSQVGVALRAGHPVYFVVFFRRPEPGQTLHDVCSAERAFVRHVRELHPDAPKPAVVGNCQGGWSAMMLAAASPDDTGPVVVVGAPMSYWGGAWSEGAGDNPMRYAGGLLGGSWLASLSSDLGGGTFDGAWLVQNFENLNPANTFWDKYYNVFANVDTETDRFLDFERWWGGYYLLNREEIEWITQNLFVGNRLWAGTGRSDGGFDLRDVKAPIVLFASLGDNITPPQQAFNWVADVYRSTEEIKLRGQVIVGLMHEDIGHLGIFVSGKVAKKEHAQIVSVLQSIEALPPGLYGMKIAEREDAAGQPAYDVSFVELRLEDAAQRLNRLERDDEKVFEAVNAVSEFNQRAYELFLRPWVQALASEPAARLQRAFHPLRWQRWAMSDLNPATWWLAPAARWAREHRQPLPGDHPARRGEAALSDLSSASLDHFKAVRDAAAEATFFHLYGPLRAAGVGKRGGDSTNTPPSDPRQLPFVQAALARVDSGGYAEAVARVAFLMAHEEVPLPLSRLQLAHELLKDYRQFLPALAPDELRRIAGEQEVIARLERDRAIEALPSLLPDPQERLRLIALIERVLADERVHAIEPSAEQRKTLAHIRRVLGVDAPKKKSRRLATAAA